MDRAPIPDRPDLLPIFPTPPELERDTERMVEKAPRCGLGFKKGRLDSELHERLLANLQDNIGRFRAETGLNPWMGTVNNRVIPAIFWEDREFNAMVSKALQPAHEEWSGRTLSESACYGIRVYQRGCYLFNHVDRTETHVVSSTICVDHRLDKPWPLHIEDLEGEPHQVDMEPGDFLFYEGALLRHGRPYPLRGDYSAGKFGHYRPVDDETTIRLSDS